MPASRQGHRTCPPWSTPSTALARSPCRPVAQHWRESRYDRYASGPAGFFAGDTLLHGDINPDNLLVGPDGDVTIVDWSWPTRGAAFIDPACLAVQLIAAGHTPAQAERWAARSTAWREADPVAVDAFAAATVRMYQRFEQLDPEPWRKAMTAAAVGWAEHRKQTSAGPGGVLPGPFCQGVTAQALQVAPSMGL
jgi:Ser/Thr protein kinase RdoA (MazF antagonist)